MPSDLKILIAGGCFPVQDNIEYHKLYHQLLKSKLEDKFDCNIDISIIRYENIARCMDKIVEAVNTENPDIIIFHIRVEPILGLSKLYHVYQNRNGEIVKTFRLSSGSIIRYRKAKSQQNEYSQHKTAVHCLLRELNYLFGYLAGNRGKILKAYLELIVKLIAYCKVNNIIPIITGPVSRPHSYFENYTSHSLHSYIYENIEFYNPIYINCLGSKNEDNKTFFCEDGIRVNEIGHKRISDLILDKIIIHNMYSKGEITYGKI